MSTVTEQMAEFLDGLKNHIESKSHRNSIDREHLCEIRRLLALNEGYEYGELLVHYDTGAEEEEEEKACKIDEYLTSLLARGDDVLFETSEFKPCVVNGKNVLGDVYQGKYQDLEVCLNKLQELGKDLKAKHFSIKRI